MISQIFVLSPRGDVLIFKDFRGDVARAAPDAFFRRVARAGGPRGAAAAAAPPAFALDGVHFLHVRLGGLFWVATTRENASPSLVLELLARLHWVAKDYCGAATEDAIRRNFLLVYELLDEVVDYGFPQNSSTERLRQFVATEPAPVRPARPLGPGAAAAAGPAEVAKSVLDVARTGAREEIFVDIVERLTAVFDAQGRLRAHGVAGALQVRSYLAGNPAIRLGLCDGVVLAGADGSMAAGGGSAGGFGGGERGRGGSDDDEGGFDYRPGGAGGRAEPVALEAWTLHDAADRARFLATRDLELVPPEGHFTLLSYRSARPFRPPFRLAPALASDAGGAGKMTLTLRLRADFAAERTATAVAVVIPLPAEVQRVHCELEDGGAGGAAAAGGRAPEVAALLAPLSRAAGVPAAFEQSAEWDPRRRALVWAARGLRGGRELALRARLTVDAAAHEAVRAGWGPISVQFVLPGKPSASGLDVRYLKVLREERGPGPARWFRAVATAHTYQVRTG
jgi:AP-4 complex subunit mu-1